MRFFSVAWVCYVFLLGLGPLAGHAGDLQLKRTVGENSVLFEYRWQDRGRPDGLRFWLPVDDLQRGSNEFNALAQDKLDDEIYEALRARAREMTTPSLTVTVERQGSRGLDLRAVGWEGELTAEKMADIHEELEQVQRDVVDRVLKRGFYRRREGNMMMPDHPRVVQRYVPAVRPVAEAVEARLRGASLRDRINWMMGWLQRIPYDTLTDRYGISGGAGFQTPYGLWLNNRGDCDTKSVALMALIRAMAPEVPLVMIYAEDHAFVGVGIPQGEKDYALRLDGRVVVLADPTGPGLLPLGGVGEKVKESLARGKYWYLWV